MGILEKKGILRGHLVTKQPLHLKKKRGGKLRPRVKKGTGWSRHSFDGY